MPIVISCSKSDTILTMKRCCQYSCIHTKCLRSGNILGQYCISTAILRVLSWENFDVQLPQQEPQCLADWWEDVASMIPKQERQTFNGALIYIVWNIWKEMNRRIFENEHQTAEQVAYLAKEDIVQRRRAMCIAG